MFKPLFILSALALAACGQQSQGSSTNTALPVGTPTINQTGIVTNLVCGMDFLTKANQTFIVVLGSSPQISQPQPDGNYGVTIGSQVCIYSIVNGQIVSQATEN